MTNKNPLSQGLTPAAWGYFFLNFDINIGTVSIFPRFAGFLLFRSAIRGLSAEHRDLTLLDPLCFLLAIWNGIDWFLSWSGQTLDNRFLILDLLVTAAELYFHFQFLTDIASLADLYLPDSQDLTQRLLRHRTLYTIQLTLITMTLNLPARFSGPILSGIQFVLIIAAFLLSLCIMDALFTLRRRLPPEEPGASSISNPSE